MVILDLELFVSGCYGYNGVVFIYLNIHTQKKQAYTHALSPNTHTHQPLVSAKEVDIVE